MLLRLFLPCLCFLCLPRYLYAQTVVHVKPDRNNIRVGDTVTLQLEVRYPSGIRSEWLLPDSMSHWEWLEKGSSRQYSSGATTTSMLTCRFTGYDTGYWPLPPIVLRTGNSTYRMDTPYIRVRYANRDLAPAFREMKPLMEVATDQPGISPWIIVLVVGLAASIFFYLLVYRNRIKDKVTGVDARSPADFIAQLRMLEDAYLRAELSEQAFYDKWHAILISFLEWKMAWTTPYENARQLMDRISELELPDTMRDEVRESIMIAERVRFGQYRPGSSLIERSLQVMKKLFENM